MNSKLATELFFASYACAGAKERRKYVVKPEMFDDEDSVRWKALDEHLTKYGSLGEDAADDLGIVLGQATDALGFYYDHVVQAYNHRAIQEAVTYINKFLNKNSKDYDPLKATAYLQEVTNRVSHNTIGSDIIDLEEAGELLIQSKIDKLAGPKIITGWPTIDSEVTSLYAGDFVVYAAATSVGKSWLAMHTFLENLKKGKRGLFISMEMNLEVCAQRLAAMYSQLPTKDLKALHLSTYAKKKVLSDFVSDKLDGVLVSANMSQSLDQTVSLVSSEHPDFVVVDGAYLIQTNSKSVWEAQKEVAEGIKSKVAENLGIPVICTYQLNKEGAKAASAKKVKPVIQDLAGGMAIGNAATLAYAIIESDEDIHQRKLIGMKSRNGMLLDVVVNFKLDIPDFTEYTNKITAFEELYADGTEVEVEVENYEAVEFGDEIFGGSTES